MDAEHLLTLLNEYFDEMTTIVLEEGGFLDKYIGDAIMAFWNAPRDVADHADRALRTAVVMQRRLGELNRRWRYARPGHEDLRVRIGVHTGEVVVGNVGSEQRFEYSAIGDPVNVAARLEPANKSYQTLSMVSESTLAAVDRTAYRVRELDLIAVKGKEEPVRVYELLELAGFELPPDKEAALRCYELGMASYRCRNWSAAKGHFEAALAACPADGPSRVYLARCTDHIAAPPPADWDFVVHRTEKYEIGPVDPARVPSSPRSWSCVSSPVASPPSRWRSPRPRRSRRRVIQRPSSFASRVRSMSRTVAPRPPRPGWANACSSATACCLRRDRARF
jgi:adenylate cyclase